VSGLALGSVQKGSLRIEGRAWDVLPEDVSKPESVGSGLHAFRVKIFEFRDVTEDGVQFPGKSVDLLIGEFQTRQKSDMAHVFLGDDLASYGVAQQITPSSRLPTWIRALPSRWDGLS